jgi:SM-20-related protein
MEHLFETLIDAIAEKEYAVIDDFISQQSIIQLLDHAQQLKEQGAFKQAGIGKGDQFQNNESIRNDSIYWLSDSTIATFCPELSDKLNLLIQYLNRYCYSGINSQEFHLAHYQTGSFYKRHLDQFRGNDERRFTFIVYLNKAWQKEDGGELTIYQQDTTIKVSPEAGRLVLFNSQKIEHEVLPTTRDRWSFTGWLKSSNRVLANCSNYF